MAGYGNRVARRIVIMRVLPITCCLTAITLCCPAATSAQEVSTTYSTSAGLRQTTVIEDPFQDTRVPVSPSAFPPVRRDAVSQGPTSVGGSQDQGGQTASSSSAATTSQSQRSAFDRGADLDPLQDSALAYSGGDSIAREAQDRERLSALAATGQLPPVDEEVQVRRRAAPEDPYAASGIRRGSFVLSPQLEVGGVYTSNPLSQSRTGPDDTGLRIAPTLALRSDWERHAVAFDFTGEHIFYDKFDDQNVNNFSAAVSGRVDIRSTTTLDVSAGFGQSQSNAASFEVPDSARGLRDDRAYNVLARLTHQMNRVITQVTGSATWFKFGNVDLGPGLEELNQDRDYVAPAGGLRVGYQISEALQPFVEVTYAPRIHDVSVDRNGLRRDSQGVVIRSGLSFNDGALWAGEIAARFEFRDYEDTILADQTALGMDANVTWSPTELTSVVFSANSQVEESADPLVAAATTWTAGVLASHQLRDNLAVEAGVSVGYTDYDGVSDETVIITTLGLAYALRPEVEMIAGYEFTSQNPGDAGGYDDHRISAGMRFRL